MVTRGTVGLTVTCARCHDHKFDPISTKDYYALHGVFASSQEPGELPLLGAAPDPVKHDDFLKQRAAIEKEIEDFKAAEVAKFLSELRQHAGDYMLGAAEAPDPADASKFDTFAGERKLEPTVLRRWIAYLEKKRKANDPLFMPWFESVAWSAGISPARAPEPNQLVLIALNASKTNSLKQTADIYSKLFTETDTAWKAALEAAKKESKSLPTSLPDADREALRQVLYAEDAPGNLPKADAESVLSRKLNEGLAPLRNKIEALNWTHPGAPARAMALVDRDAPVNSHVLLRGNPASPGEEVQRRFIELLAQTPAETFTNGSGRLDLARCIANRSNPLTARVYVNRIWLHHLGQGLVSTPGDFGIRTEEPVHRALLDYLAAEFMEHGWSTKYLHRLILLSATWQQSSDASPAAEDGPGQSPAFPHESTAIGFRGDARYRAGRRGHAGSNHRGPASGYSRRTLFETANTLWIHRSAKPARPVSNLRLCQPRHFEPGPFSHHRSATGAIPDEQPIYARAGSQPG